MDARDSGLDEDDACSSCTDALRSPHLVMPFSVDNPLLDREALWAGPSERCRSEKALSSSKGFFNAPGGSFCVDIPFRGHLTIISRRQSSFQEGVLTPVQSLKRKYVREKAHMLKTPVLTRDFFTSQLPQHSAYYSIVLL